MGSINKHRRRHIKIPFEQNQHSGMQLWTPPSTRGTHTFAFFVDMLVELNGAMQGQSFKILEHKYSEYSRAFGRGIKDLTMEEKLYTHWTKLPKYSGLRVTSYTVCENRRCVRVCVCSLRFSSFDHADRMHALPKWNHHQPPSCCIPSYFFLEQTLSCKFCQGQPGQVPPGFFIADIGDETGDPLKFRVSSMNTDAGPDDPAVFLSVGLWQDADPNWLNPNWCTAQTFPSMFYLRTFLGKCKGLRNKRNEDRQKKSWRYIFFS